MSAPHVFVYEQVDWDDPLASAPPGKRPPKEIVEKARSGGARRKKIVRGEGGFFMNRSLMAPGFEVPAHSHSHAELIVVLSGGCRLDDGTRLGPGDSIVIHAETRYGFTCGDEGMDFLTIRTGEASVDLASGR
ncbi:MAG: cupin domain-containing protein [Myxococcota bacterium]